MISVISVLSVPVLHAGAMFLSASAAALVGLHAAMLAIGASRAALSPRARMLVPVGAALLLGAWLGWALVVAQERAVIGPVEGRQPLVASLPTLACIVAAIGVGSAFLALPSVRAANAAIPAAWLIAVQVYRTAGATFLWPFMGEGGLPPGFAWPAGIGDAATGLLAPFVAWAVVRRRRGAYGWAVAWNWFGLLDLVVAPTAAVLTGARVAELYPLGLIPIFLGPPMGILTHIYSLRNLASNRVSWMESLEDGASTASLPARETVPGRA